MSTDRPEELAAKIAAALERLARAQRAHRQRVATERGLTPLQLDLVTTLADGVPPDPVVGRLAIEVGVSQPTVTDSLRTLERKGLVERRRDPADGRRASVVLTALGRALTNDLGGPHDEVTAAIATLPAETQEVVLQTLLVVIARFVDHGVIDVARTCFTCENHRFDGTTHRCALLDVDLPVADLRVNCPDHRAA